MVRPGSRVRVPSQASESVRAIAFRPQLRVDRRVRAEPEWFVPGSPVKVAYLVLSHRNPDQVLRLVRALAEGPASVVLVRHDQRVTGLGAAQVEAAGGVLVDDGIELEWGGWSQLEVILAGLRRAAEIRPDWALVLSGQDYPLRPMADIEADLAASDADGMLCSVREADLRRPKGDEEFFLRVSYRHYRRPRRLRASSAAPRS